MAKAKWKNCSILISDQGFTVVGFKDPMTMINLHPKGRYYPNRDQAKDLLEKLQGETVCPPIPGNPAKRAEWINCTCKEEGTDPSSGTDCLCRIITGTGKKRRMRDLPTKGIAIAIKKEW